jgi:hypothetical protein
MDALEARAEVARLAAGGDSNTGVSTTTAWLSGPHKVAEDKISSWLTTNSFEALPGAGQPLPKDHHGDAAKALGLGDDFVQSKILKDNGFVLRSVELRRTYDDVWSKFVDDVNMKANESSGNALLPLFDASIKEMNELARQVNENIVSDSLRYNGRCPVKNVHVLSSEMAIEKALREGGVK